MAHRSSRSLIQKDIHTCTSTISLSLFMTHTRIQTIPILGGAKKCCPIEMYEVASLGLLLGI